MRDVKYWIRTDWLDNSVGQLREKIRQLILKTVYFSSEVNLLNFGWQYTSFVVKREPKKRNFSNQKYQKVPKTLFWPVFSKLCLRRRKLGQTGVFVSARKINLIDLKVKVSRQNFRKKFWKSAPHPPPPPPLGKILDNLVCINDIWAIFFTWWITNHSLNLSAKMGYHKNKKKAWG